MISSKIELASKRKEKKSCEQIKAGGNMIPAGKMGNQVDELVTSSNAGDQPIFPAAGLVSGAAICFHS